MEESIFLQHLPAHKEDILSKATKQAYHWSVYAGLLNLLGSLLITTPNRLPASLLDPEAWRNSDTLDNACLHDAFCRFALFLDELLRKHGEDALTEAACEQTALFIGPPKPTCPPWEGFYAEQHNEVGYGRCALEMLHALQDAHLSIEGSNRQYADHIGIECMYAATLAQRIADVFEHTSEQNSDEDHNSNKHHNSDEDENSDDVYTLMCTLKAFLADHPCSWIDALYERVQQHAPDAYCAHLLELVRAVLNNPPYDENTLIAKLG